MIYYAANLSGTSTNIKLHMLQPPRALALNEPQSHSVSPELSPKLQLSQQGNSDRSLKTANTKIME